MRFQNESFRARGRAILVWTAVAAVASLALALWALSAQAQTTVISGTAGGPNGSHDTWNNPANWDAGIPSGAMDAIVDAGITAEAWNNATPAYTGTLELRDGATLQMGWTTSYPQSLNALGGAGVTLNDGSQIRLRMPFSLELPGFTLAGDASIHLSPSTSAHHTTRNLNSSIAGPGALTVIGNNNNTMNLNAGNPGWSGGFVANADDSWRVEANASGAFGTGDVTFNARAANDRGVTLQVDAPDVIADTASLLLNGPRDHRKLSKLILNASDTVFGFWQDGGQFAPGVYNSGSGLTDVLGNPLITGSGNLTVSGIAATATAGNWDLDWSAQPEQLTANKTATDAGPFDIEINTSGGQSVRDIIETVLNDAGFDWPVYMMELGYGLGDDFVPSSAGDGLGFATASSTALPSLTMSEDALSFGGGTVSAGGSADFNLTVDLPTSDPFTFTLRQYTVPEPGTAILLGMALCGLGGFVRRRKR